MSEILKHLTESQALEQQIDQAELREPINRLRHWQSVRLLRTYQTLYQQSRFAPAMDFFTEELYGPNDFSQRDQDIKKVLPLMEAMLSKETLATFELALQLNTLSYQLDFDLLKQLEINTSINSENYCCAFRLSDNLDARKLQLSLVEALAYNLDKIAHRASIMMLLKLSRKPAKLAGLSTLQCILESGAKAFRKIGNIDNFIQPILQTEEKIMHQLFQGENPLEFMDQVQN